MTFQNGYYTVFSNDVNKAKEFFISLGFSYNENYSGPNSAAFKISDNLMLMILSKEGYKKFSQKPLVDSMNQTGYAMSLELETVEEVDNVYNKALKAGASINKEPKDYGMMYEGSFYDLDGHGWSLFHMPKNSFK